MAAGSKVAPSDYNGLQSSVNTLMGTGGPGIQQGWGKTPNSSQISLNGKINATDWNNLRKDIVDCYLHTNGTLPSTVPAYAGSAFTGSIALSNTVTFTGSITAGVLTVTSAPTGVGIQLGMAVTGSGVPNGLFISSNISGTGTASSSTWNVQTAPGVANTQPVSSTTLTGSTWILTAGATASTGGIELGHRVNAVASNSTLVPSTYIVGNNATNPTILSGTGLSGTYLVNQPVAVASQSLTTTKTITWTDYTNLNTALTSVVASGNAVPPDSQAATYTFPAATRTTSWNGTVTHTATLTWASGSGYTAAQSAAWFFNSGGQIRITASQPVSPAPASKDSSWNVLLSNLGTIIIGGTTVTQTGSSGTTTITSSAGFFNLTTADQTIVSKTTASLVYSPNDYKILARVDNTTTRTVLYLTIKFEDLNPSPVGAPSSGSNVVDELVSSSATYPLTSQVVARYSYGTATGGIFTGTYLPTITQSGP